MLQTIPLPSCIRARGLCLQNNSQFLALVSLVYNKYISLCFKEKKNIEKNFWRMCEVFLMNFIFYSVHMLKRNALLKDYYTCLISSGQPCFKATNWRLLSFIAYVFTLSFQLEKRKLGHLVAFFMTSTPWFVT